MWTSSAMVDITSPRGGVDLNDLDVWKLHRNTQYSSSRAGNWFLASEFHRRFGGKGVLNICKEEFS